MVESLPTDDIAVSKAPESLPRGLSGLTARQIAVHAAREAGKIVRGHFGKVHSIGHKGRGNFVTETDVAAEQAILARLRQEFSDHGILAEETGGTDAGPGYTWVVDPLDGTTNFATQLPVFAVSIALVSNGEAVLGVIYDPLRCELFVAARGRGAYLNGRRIQANPKVDLANCLLGFDLGYDEDGRQQAMAVASGVRPSAQTLRLIGSAVLGQAYVACGRFDLYFHHYLYPWDVAAAQIVLREAGALVTEWDGRPATVASRGIVAAHPNVHRAFVAVLRQERPVPR